MLTNVTFRHPAEFVRFSEEDGILAVEGAKWFLRTVRGIPRLNVEEKMCQEDWGVVLFAERDGKKFWIGLSSAEDHVWWAHLHHGSFAWLQWISASGKQSLKCLALDFDQALRTDPAVSEIVWYLEGDTKKANPRKFNAPAEG